jgi:hypothetical protein
MRTVLDNPTDKVNRLLFEAGKPSLALLLDLATLLPESLLETAIALARAGKEPRLRAFLLRALAKRLRPLERKQVMLDITLPVGVKQSDLCLPEGKQLRRLMTRLTNKQRVETFSRLFELLEVRKRSPKPKAKSARKKDRKTKGGGGRIFGARRSVARKDGPPLKRNGGGAKSKHSAGPRVRRDFSMKKGINPRLKEPLSAGPSEPAGPHNIVSRGFSPPDAPHKPLSEDLPLKCGESYYFWFKIGYEQEGAIGDRVSVDFEKLPSEARLRIVLFAFDNELQITSGADVGALQIELDQKVVVAQQPTANQRRPLAPQMEAFADMRFDDPHSLTTKNTLFFPVRTPDSEGLHRLRCNIYCEQVLVQSHLVSATVRRNPVATPKALDARVDYALSHTLRAAHVSALASEPHLLSLMINSNGDGSHSFRFYGQKEFKDDVNMDGQTLKGLLRQARQAMQKVSWGDEAEWDDSKNWPYRYQEEVFDQAKLAKDLAYLARAGWRIYASFVSYLKVPASQLETLMANPGLLQIALKLSPRAVLPAAVIYDYAWKPDQFDFDKTVFELCPTFSQAIEDARNGGPALEDCGCFKGACHVKAQTDEVTKEGSKKTLYDLPPMICPSGFWGYRHSLGLPLTIDGINDEAPPLINFGEKLNMIAGVSSDPFFVERDPHFSRLEKLKSLTVERFEKCGPIITRMKGTVPHLLYFYCHGGIRADSELPYLGIGESDRFGPEDVLGNKISWKDPHPLVFINGCRTTSLNPEVTLDFVSSFVQQAGASGVVGTEITIFEPLAVAFAEAFLRRFLGISPFKAGTQIGKAIRGARLELLQRGNPLGLVYIPYAIATLSLASNTKGN